MNKACMHGGLAALLALSTAACDREPPAPPPRIKEVFHLNGYEADFGYAQAVLIDKTLYVSGSLSADAQGRLVAPADMAGQLRAAYINVQHTLAAHGAGFEQVVKETIYTTDMEAFLKAKSVRLDFYDKQRLPAASWVQVQRLVDPGFLVQVDVIAELQ